MTRRTGVLTVALLIVAAGCSDQLGRAIPDCDLNQVRAEIIMQAQAVPSADIGPCVTELEPGWSYEHQVAESGRARFWLSSDRMGDRFVEVSLTETCERGFSIRRPSPYPGVEAFLTGQPYVDPVPLTLVPVADRVVEYAASIGVDLAGELVNGRPFELRMAPTGDASAQVTAALEAGRFVVVVDDADVAEETLELRTPRGEIEIGISVPHALEEIEDEVTEPRYEAAWYFEFEGGCITWDFNAEGEMVASLEEDMLQSVGFFDLAEVRRVAGELGFYIGE